MNSSWLKHFARTRNHQWGHYWGRLWNRLRSQPNGQRQNRSNIADACRVGMANQAAAIRFFANPGPRFEERATPKQAEHDTVVRAVAFYLPQFHAFAENDQWWGTGFTEWRNVARGTPRYAGHYQPRIPRDLGFYDLGNAAVMQSQIELASAAGINAFCFYYYWFNGKRLMQRPLDLFMEQDTEQQFCIMWANENWTRRWDGRDHDVLISQDYAAADEDDFIEDTARHMAHPRYVRVRQRPLFIVYRASLLPEAASTIDRWRSKWTDVLGVEPLIFMVQSYTDLDPRQFHCDGAIEFPPHKVSRDLPRQNRHQQFYDPQFSGQVRAYTDVIDKALQEPAPPYPLIKTVSPHWDNDARREGTGVTFQGSTPEHYHRWLSGAIRHAQLYPIQDESLVFINAWNEWAEAAYLEPDIHFGHAYLNTTYRALVDRDRSTTRQFGVPKLLLVGHDAHPNGAQMLLLALLNLLRSQYREQINVQVLLLGEGTLLPQYEALAPTALLSDIGMSELPQWLATQHISHALCNTCVSGKLLEPLRQAQVTTLALVHEMPTLIREYQLFDAVQAISEHADAVVFPSQTVLAGFQEFAPSLSGTVSIRAQGIYKSVLAEARAGQALRASLGVADNHKLIINIAYADHRKGFDIFVKMAEYMVARRDDVHFMWIGARSGEMDKWLRRHSKVDRLHLAPFTDDVASCYNAADCFYLSSREDPFPSVVLEAMSIGLPVVMGQNTTGFDHAILHCALLSDPDNPESVQLQLNRALDEDSAMLRSTRMALIRDHYSLHSYTKHLLSQLQVLAETG